jgi:hypothetical protein
LATGAELKIMAGHRLEEGQLLHDNGFFAGSVYMAGYAVEFGLKSIISKNLGVEIFGGGIRREHVRSFHVHSLTTLIVLAGLQPTLDNDLANDIALNQAWSGVSTWDETKRYEFGCSQQTATDFMNHVRRFMTWIGAHW